MERGLGGDTPIRPMQYSSKAIWFHGTLYYQTFVDSFSSATRNLSRGEVGK